MIRTVIIFCLLAVSISAQQWRQISGPPVSLQASQFIAPSTYQSEALIILYTHTVDNKFGEDFVRIALQANDVPGDLFYGMRIESIKGDENLFEVTTNGATYKVDRNSVDLIRRIDPLTNSINPRAVAHIAYSDVGELQVVSANSESCVISSSRLTFEIYSDSAMTLTNSSLLDFSYTYQNLLVDAPRKVGPRTERFWTDGYGGSLHARNPAKSGIYSGSFITEDSFSITLGVESGSFVAVFPPKFFDFEALYGADSRPHVWFAGIHLDYAEANLDKLRNQGFGVIMIWANLYNGIQTGLVTKNEAPIYDVDAEGNRFNYRFEWEDPIRVSQAITAFHNKGFKVISYLQGGLFSNVQDKELTLEFMRNFQNEWNLDGWYFDNAHGGKNWFDSYLFMKAARKDVGDDGIIYHHDSVDLWTGLARDGRVLVPSDAYANYTLKGETGTLSEQIHDPNNPYLRYYSSGYGFAQTIGAHKLASNGKPSLMRTDLRRASAQNLNGSSRSGRGINERAWDGHYEPSYLQRKAEYLSGDFSPDVLYPVDWWSKPTNITVEIANYSSATFKWTTSLPANSNIRIAAPGEAFFIWSNPGISDSSLVLNHIIVIPNLLSGEEYRYAIHSTDGNRVWSHYGTFTTPVNVP